ncbi:efflux RND transporter permease subunit [Polaribacter sejongensis]
MALSASLVIALFIIPPLAAFLFRKTTLKKSFKYIVSGVLILAGLVIVISGFWLGFIVVAFGISGVLGILGKLDSKKVNLVNIIISSAAIVFLLAEYWRPLGFNRSIFINLIFVAIICFGILGLFSVFRKYYGQILQWALANKMLFLMVPITVLVSGFWIMNNTGKEFMPSLNEGSFLLMPTSLPHSGVEENKRVLQQLDMAVATIPEIETVVGKAGRTESALDPAPLSMYENMIQYKSEYMRNSEGKRQRYKVNADGLFELKTNVIPTERVTSDEESHIDHNNNAKRFVTSGTSIKANQLIEDNDGEFYRNWRPEIKSPDDIWKEIIKVTKLPGVTSAPKLQPIETRLVMLQTRDASTYGN